MLVVQAAFPIAAEHRERATELIRELAEHSREEEEAIIEYRVAVDVDDENLFRFFEQYEDEAAFGAHAESDHFKRFEAELPELLVGVPEVTQFEVESATDVEL
jgi:quinol monooxygenase YgiN